MSEIIKFHKATAFSLTVKEAVNTYFAENNISKYGDWRLHTKAIFFVSLHWILWYTAVFVDIPPPARLIPFSLMGLISMPGIGFNVFHDGSHGAASKKKWVNRLYALSGNMLGVVEFFWRIQHNILHHTYTNVPGEDPDIKQDPLLITDQSQQVRPYHKYQHIYCWFLYLFQSFYWVISKDYKNFRDMKVGNKEIKEKDHSRVLLEYALTKIFHAVMMIGIPLFFVEWWVVIVGYTLMMGLSGLVLACVFQLAHQVEKAQIVYKEEIGGDEWFIHELATTVNFKTNKLFQWFVGGLNYQVEHHLFRDISHIHYPKVSKILKEVCKEYEIPYHENPTFRYALGSHGRYLKKLRDSSLNTKTSIN